MKVTFDGIQQKADEFAAEERRQQEEAARAFEEAIAEETDALEKKYRASAYCPKCCREIRPDELEEQGYYDKVRDDPHCDKFEERIGFLPKCVAYSEYVGTNIKCPDCDSTFMENEKRRTIISVVPKTMLKLATAFLIIFTIGAFGIGLGAKYNAKQMEKHIQQAIEIRMEEKQQRYALEHKQEVEEPADEPEAETPVETPVKEPTDSAQPSALTESFGAMGDAIQTSLKWALMLFGFCMVSCGVVKTAKALCSPGYESPISGIIMTIFGAITMMGFAFLSGTFSSMM